MSSISLLKDFLPKSIRKFVLQHYYSGKLRKAIQNRLYDRDLEFEYFRKLIRKGDCVADIGANFGYYTTFFSKLVNDEGCVYSIEPIPLTFDILSNNTKKLNLSNVQVFNVAVSDNTGTGIMEIPKYQTGGNNFYQARLIDQSQQGKSSNRYSVSTETLDAMFIQNDTPISFIKIDVEGHELNVINGALALLQRFKPAMYIEVSENPDEQQSSAGLLFKQLAQLDYSPYLCEERKLRRRSEGDVRNDYFFLTPQHYQKIQSLE